MLQMPYFALCTFYLIDFHYVPLRLDLKILMFEALYSFSPKHFKIYFENSSCTQMKLKL